MKICLLTLFFIIPSIGWSQDYIKPDLSDKTRYENKEYYEVKNYTKKKLKKTKAKNINAFFIGITSTFAFMNVIIFKFCGKKYIGVEML